MQPLYSLVQKPKKHLINRILVCKTIANLNPFTLPGLKKTNTSKDDWETRPSIWRSKTRQNDQMKQKINILRTDSNLCSLLKKVMLTSCLIWNLKTPGYKEFNPLFFFPKWGSKNILKWKSLRQLQQCHYYSIQNLLQKVSSQIAREKNRCSDMGKPNKISLKFFLLLQKGGFKHPLWTKLLGFLTPATQFSGGALRHRCELLYHRVLGMLQVDKPRWRLDKTYERNILMLTKHRDYIWLRKCTELPMSGRWAFL